MPRKKQISTTIDEWLYREIKEKGYKISTLIEKGLKYAEQEDKILNEEYIKSLFVKLDNLIKRIEKITNENIRNKVKLLISFLESERSELLSKKIISRYDINRVFIKIEEKILEIFEL